MTAGIALPGSASADDDVDRANVRLVASGKRLTITWYTTWLAAGGAHDAGTRALATRLREQEQKHYDLLAPVLGDTAPVDDDFDFTLPRSATASVRAAVDFSLTLERMLTGIGVAAAGTTTNPGVSQALARVAASDSNHAGALAAQATGSVLGPSLPKPIDVATASDELARYLH